MRFALASAVLLATAVGVTAAPIPKAKVKDEESILGTWQVENLDFGPGTPVPPIDFKQMKFTFKAGGKLTMSMGDMPPKEGSYKLDPAAKVKAIDMTEANGRAAPGIYELDGDTLKICIAEGPDAVRPTELKPDGKRVAVVTLNRIKEEKKEK
jgi:uncharacterized protein (TIGR03067 family)